MNEARQQFYSQINHFWHDLFDTEYALFDIKVESIETIQRIRKATARIGHIFTKIAHLLRQLDDATLLALGFPIETFAVIRMKLLPIDSVIARLDLVVLPDSIKVLELNADTPTFIKETFHVNGKVCEEFGYGDPNIGCDSQLQTAIRKALQLSCRDVSNPNIVFAAHDDHEEDKMTTFYLKELFGLPSQYLDFHELRLLMEPENERGLYDQHDRKIDVLYRQTYPLEHAILDEDPTTYEKVGQLLLEFVANGELAMINPSSAFLLQSKAVMAVIWGLHEQRHPFFNDDEHKWIADYFLPTYLEPDLFLEKGLTYVKKPAFGREGDTVAIFSSAGNIMQQEIHKTYIDELAVYQQFIELPTTVVQTEQGVKELNYMYGSFLINGEPSAVGIRAGGQITNNTSYFLPVGVERAER